MAASQARPGATQVVPSAHTVPGPSRGGSVAQCPRVPPHSLASNRTNPWWIAKPRSRPQYNYYQAVDQSLVSRDFKFHLGLSTVEQSCWWQQTWLCPCFWFSIHCLDPWPGITSSRWSQLWDTNKWTQYATAQLQTCHQLIDSYQFVQLKNVFTLIGRAGKIKFLDIHLDKTRYKWQLIDVPLIWQNTFGAEERRWWHWAEVLYPASRTTLKLHASGDCKNNCHDN